MRADPDKLRQRKQYLVRAILPAFFAFLILSSGAFFGYSTTCKYLQQTKLQRTVLDLEHLTRVIEKEIEVYKSLLHGTRGLYEASQSVEQDEWNQYAKSQIEGNRYPALITLRYVERVPAAEKESFDFKIYPESSHDEFFPIKYLFPLEGNELMLGHDLGTEPSKIRNMESASASDDVSILANATLVTNVQNALLLTLPIYKKNSPISTPEERQQGLQGYVQAVCDSDRLFKGFLGRGLFRTHFQFKVYLKNTFQGSVDSELIYQGTADNDASQQLFENTPSARSTISVGSQAFEVEIFSAPHDAALTSPERKLPLIILFAGLAVSLLFAGVIFSFGLSRIFAIGLAEKMTEDIKEGEERLNNLVQLAADPIIILDTLGFIRRYNSAAEKVSGYPASEILGRHFLKTNVLLGANSIARALKEFGLILTGQSERPPYELSMKHKDGHIFMVEAHSKGVLHGGKLDQIIVIFRDITERIRIENEMRSLSVAMEQNPASVVITGVDGNIEYVNPKFCEVTGYKASEVKGQNPRILKSGMLPKEIYKKMWDTILSGQTWRGEFANKKKSGEIYWESASISPIKDYSGKIIRFIAVKEDVTEKKSLEAKLLQAQKMESVGTLAGGIAHDLNNQLTPLLGYVELAQAHENLDDETKEMLSEISSAGRRCADIVRMILNFSRPSGHEKAIFDCQKLIDEHIHLIRSSLPANIHIQVKSQKNLLVLGNETEIQTVLMNLTTNARDAMVPKGGSLTIEARRAGADEIQPQRERAASAYIQICVQDTGSGMTPETLKRIFEPFFTTKPKGRGTGLGLAMSYKIIQEHGGWIDVSSAVGAGSVFNVYLPIAESAPGVSAEAGLLEQITKSRGGECLMLVDDEEPLRRMGKILLEKLGYKVETASDGEEALKFYEQNHTKIHAVVLDMTMPKLSGMEVLKGLLKINKKAKIIVASGFTSEGSVKDLTQAGAAAFLQKPYSIGSFASLIRSVLDSKKI